MASILYSTNSGGEAAPGGGGGGDEVETTINVARDIVGNERNYELNEYMDEEEHRHDFHSGGEAADNNEPLHIPVFTQNEQDNYVKFAYQDLQYSSPEEEYIEYTSKNKKSCSKCGLKKYLYLFNGNSSGSDTFDRNGYRLRRPECSECSKKIAKGKNKAKKKAREMGIPYKAPEGEKCAISGELPKKGDGLIFDHCHETDTFRGYILNSKNRALGALGDNVEGLLVALNYLNTSEKKKIVQDEITGELKIVN